MRSRDRFDRPRWALAMAVPMVVCLCGCAQTEAWRQARLREIPRHLVRLTGEHEDLTFESNGFIWRGLVVTAGHTGKVIAHFGNCTITRGDEVYQMADIYVCQQDDWCLIAPTVPIDGGLEIGFQSPKGYGYAVAYREEELVITYLVPSDWTEVWPADVPEEKKLAVRPPSPPGSPDPKPYGCHFCLRSEKPLGGGCSGSVMVTFGRNRTEVSGMLIFGMTGDDRYHGYMPFWGVAAEFLKAADTLRAKQLASSGA